MSEHNISIKGGKTFRLKTAGKYCDRDIVVNAPDNLDALFDMTITEVNSDAAAIPEYRLKDCSLLTKANFPNATLIGEKAFNGCVALAEVNFPKVAEIKGYAFCGCSSLEEADFPLLTKVSGNYAFDTCSALHTVNMPKLEYINAYCFRSCANLTKVKFPAAASVATQAFYNCTNLRIADVGSPTNISTNAFNSCPITALAIRTTSVCKLSNTNALGGTPIASGTGYIYVPAALVESYKAASNWSAYAAQFRALEDYTVDGTVTGELDESKMFGGDPIA